MMPAITRLDPATRRMDTVLPTIVGSYLSPYVRKVLVCLHLKVMAYRIDPIVPFYGNDDFARLSPLRRVPLYIDDQVALSDSTVIREYLDERHPGTTLLPPDPAHRARARWLEEFADTQLGEVFVWNLFNQLVIRHFVWGEVPDGAVVRHALEHEIPQALDYLEGELPADGYVFGTIGRADVALASFFRNASFARYSVDAARWPRTQCYVARVLAHQAFEALRALETLSARTPIAQHRSALQAAGAPISELSFGISTPRRGVFTV
jgi:glutathione S-transferase